MCPLDCNRRNKGLWAAHSKYMGKQCSSVTFFCLLNIKSPEIIITVKSDDIHHKEVWLHKQKPYMAKQATHNQTVVHRAIPTLHRSSGIYLAYSPSLSQTPFWFPRRQLQHFIMHSQGTQQQGTGTFLFSKQASHFLAHSCLPVQVCRVVIKWQTPWLKHEANAEVR